MLRRRPGLPGAALAAAGVVLLGSSAASAEAAPPGRGRARPACSPASSSSSAGSGTWAGTSSGNVIHAPQSGDVLEISSLGEPYRVASWVGARRILCPAEPPRRIVRTDPAATIPRMTRSLRHGTPHALAAALERPDREATWNGRVDAWEDVAASPAFQRLAERVLEAAEPRPDDVVVDLGAGTGLLGLALAPRVERVLAVDFSTEMLRRLGERAASAGLENVETFEADLRRLPFEDESATLVVSNYAFHHLGAGEKELALAEARRILAPGGRLVVCDMMFALSLGKRDRRLIADKVTAILRRGPAGVVRLAKNGIKIVTGRWEHPAPPEAWRQMLEARRFEQIRVELVEQEAGIASARRPERPRS